MAEPCCRLDNHQQPFRSVLSVLLRGTRVRREAHRNTATKGSCTNASTTTTNDGTTNSLKPLSAYLPPLLSTTRPVPANDGTYNIRDAPLSLNSTVAKTKQRQRLLDIKENKGQYDTSQTSAGDSADELDFFGYCGRGGSPNAPSGCSDTVPSHFSPSSSGLDKTGDSSFSKFNYDGAGNISNNQRVYEEAAILRKKHRIHIKAADVSTLPKPFENFTDCVITPYSAFVQQNVISTQIPTPEEHSGDISTEDTSQHNKKMKVKERINTYQTTPPSVSLHPTPKGRKSSRSKMSIAAAQEALSPNEKHTQATEKDKCVRCALHRLPDWVIQNLCEANIITPTPIQMQAIPVLLRGENLLASAPTGSGKTLAFLLPLIALLKRPLKSTLCRMVVICPSRELARQTQRTFDRFGEALVGARDFDFAETSDSITYIVRVFLQSDIQLLLQVVMIVGAVGRKGFRCSLLDELENPTDGGNEGSHEAFDAAITTPLKLVHLLREKKISLASCRHLVLDEADKLLDHGFAPQLDEILSNFSHTRLQICLFSATLPPDVLRLADSFMHNPVHISVGAPNAAALSIEQELMFCTNEEGKLLALRTLHLTGRFIPPVLIFVQSKERAQQLHCELLYDGLFVECIHADKTKQQRDDIVDAFRRGQIWVLICTDVMARGVDFKNVEVVINYDFPPSASAYIHRIGRTGRAGRGGRAITFYTCEDLPYLRHVVGVMQQTSTCSVPPWMRQITKFNKRRGKINLQKHALRRRPILTTPALPKTPDASALKKKMAKSSAEEEVKRASQGTHKDNKMLNSSLCSTQLLPEREKTRRSMKPREKSLSKPLLSKVGGRLMTAVDEATETAKACTALGVVVAHFTSNHLYAVHP